MNWRYIETMGKGIGLLALGLLSLFAIAEQWAPWLPLRYLEPALTLILGLGFGIAFQREHQAAGGDSRGTEPTPPQVSQRG